MVRLHHGPRSHDWCNHPRRWRRRADECCHGGTINYANTAAAITAYAETIGAATFITGQLNFVLSANQSLSANTQTLTLGGLAPYAVPDVAAANNPGITVVKDLPIGFDTIALTLPQASDSKKFARLKVVITP